MQSYIKGASTAGHEVNFQALRDLSFDPILHEGYREPQDWEPDLEKMAAAIKDSQHLVVSFPLWWGGQPALLKGFFDRIFIRGFAYKYHKNDPFWDRLLEGRSADMIITADTPALYHKIMYGAPVIKQMRKQVLGFVGYKPIRHRYYAQIRKSTEKQREKWRASAEKFGASLRG